MRLVDDQPDVAVVGGDPKRLDQGVVDGVDDGGLLIDGLLAADCDQRGGHGAIMETWRRWGQFSDAGWQCT